MKTFTVNAALLFATLNTLKNVRTKLTSLPETDKAVAGSMVVVAEELVKLLKVEASGTDPRWGVVSDGLSELEKDLARSGRKIQAIKHHRERNNIGLLEAKNAVEAWMNKNGVYITNDYRPLPEKWHAKYPEYSGRNTY